MEEQQEQRSNSSKLKFIAIIAVLFVICPAISYYYLNGGAKWRKKAVSELGTYGQVNPAIAILPDGTKFDMVEGKVCVIHYFGENPDLTDINKRILDTGQKLVEQFDQKEEFRLLMVSTKGTAEFKSYAQKLPSSDSGFWVWSGAMGNWKTILINGFEYYQQASGAPNASEYYAISDTAGRIRRFYDATNQEEVDRMVQQVAILLPVK